MPHGQNGFPMIVTRTPYRISFWAARRIIRLVSETWRQSAFFGDQQVFLHPVRAAGPVLRMSLPRHLSAAETAARTERVEKVSDIRHTAFRVILERLIDRIEPETRLEICHEGDVPGEQGWVPVHPSPSTDPGDLSTPRRKDSKEEWPRPRFILSNI